MNSKSSKAIFRWFSWLRRKRIADVKSRMKVTQAGSDNPRTSTIGADASDLFEGLLWVSFRLLGKYIDRLLPRLEELKKHLSRANMKIAFPAYVAFMLLLSAVTGVITFVTSLLIALLSGATMVVSLVLSFALGFSCLVTVLVVLYVYPSMHADNRRRLLDEELPYVASHMAVLSRSGLPPERILRSLADVGAMGIRSAAAEEAANIVRDVRLMGLDVVSAIKRRMITSPSTKFVDFLDGFVSVARTGGDLTSYFLVSAKGFMDSARIAARQLIETLGGLAEAYISVMVVFPLLVIVMLSIMNMIGGGLAGLSTLFLMQVVTYVVIPVLALMMLLLLDSIMPPR